AEDIPPIVIRDVANARPRDVIGLEAHTIRLVAELRRIRKREVSRVEEILDTDGRLGAAFGGGGKVAGASRLGRRAAIDGGAPGKRIAQRWNRSSVIRRILGNDRR